MWSEQNPYRNGRQYVLAWPSSDGAENKLWELNGTWRKSLWNSQKMRSSLQKATFANYSGLTFSEIAFKHPDFEKYLTEIRDHSHLKLTVQISSDEILKQALPWIQKYNLQVERWIQNRWPDWDFLRQVHATNPVGLVIVGLKSNPMLQQIETIPMDFQNSTEFYFPHLAEKKERFKPREVIHWQESVLKKNRQFVIRPKSGVDLFESRIPETAELEPSHGPVYQSHLQLKPKVSVVIPVYNSGFYLLNTLRHLEQQDLSKDSYEVVIVDDGSSDRVSENLIELVRDFAMPITVLYYPRLRARQMGDSQFRAGLARNYGVKFARGDILVFLDSDILTPTHFLQKTLELHTSQSVVQWRREYLRKSVPCTSIRYQEIQAEAHCYVPENGYWHRFYDEAQDKGWSQMADSWKYACTYAFSLRKDLFQKAGWFRKTFCFYGLEDTDLGWRLSQAGERFHLEPTPVYHLFHEDVRSEFYNSSYRRQKLLKTTAEIFFYNNLSPDIYRVFQYLFNSWIF